MKAVICPVCNGVGMVSAGFYSRGGDCPYWVSSGGNPETCRSCDGKGWVEVSNNVIHSIPYIPYYPTTCPNPVDIKYVSTMSKQGV